MRTGRRQRATSRGGAAEAAGPPAPPSARTTVPCTSASIRSAVGEGCVPWVCSFRAAFCVNRASRLRAFKWRQSPGCKALGSQRPGAGSNRACVLRLFNGCKAYHVLASLGRLNHQSSLCYEVPGFSAQGVTD